ncbi:hypothetical protein [Hymenobacter daeguensis]
MQAPTGMAAPTLAGWHDLIQDVHRRLLGRRLPQENPAVFSAAGLAFLPSP